MPTSKKVAKLAGRELKTQKTTAEKPVAASALSQTKKKAQKTTKKKARRG